MSTKQIIKKNLLFCSRKFSFANPLNDSQNAVFTYYNSRSSPFLIFYHQKWYSRNYFISRKVCFYLLLKTWFMGLKYFVKYRLISPPYKEENVCSAIYIWITIKKGSQYYNVVVYSKWHYFEFSISYFLKHQ